MGVLKLSAVYAIAPEIKFDVVVRGPIRQVLSQLKSLGYDGVEYNISNPFEVNVNELKEVTSDYGLEVSAISTGLSYLRYGYSLSSPNEELRRKAIEFFRKYIDVSVELGSYKVVIGLARGKCEGDCTRAKELLKKSLTELDSYARERDVILLLEPLNRYETDLINRVSEALEISKEFKSVKLLLDTFHTTLEERSAYDAIDLAGRYIGHVHVADSNRLAPGMGILDWEKIVYRLIKNNYRGFLSVEARAEPSYEEMLKVASRTLKPLLV